MIEDDPKLLILLSAVSSGRTGGKCAHLLSPVSSGRAGGMCAHLVNVVLGTEFRASDPAPNELHLQPRTVLKFCLLEIEPRVSCTPSTCYH